MAYSSSLTDKEWELLEPLLSEILPPKKQTIPLAWTKRELLDGVFYQLKNGCSWEDFPKDPGLFHISSGYKGFRRCRFTV